VMTEGRKGAPECLEEFISEGVGEVERDFLSSPFFGIGALIERASGTPIEIAGGGSFDMGQGPKGTDDGH
jgi:hypothetical protein